MRLSHIHENKQWPLDPLGNFTASIDNSQTYTIFYNGKPIKTTRNKDLLNRFTMYQGVVEDLSEFKEYDGIEPLYKGDRKFHKIPGFTTTDLNRAVGFAKANNGHVVRVYPGEPKTLEQAAVVKGETGAIIFLPGLPTLLQRGSEVMVLHPAKQEVLPAK